MSAISKSVRIRYLEFLAETGMTRYEFSKRSGIPESTLWSLGQKEDYDVCLNEKSEVWLIKNFRRLSERQRGCIEGYIKALMDESGGIHQSDQ